MTFDHLNTLLAKKKMDRVEIEGGMNLGSLEMSPDDKGWKNITKILFKKQSRSWFKAEKNPLTKTFDIIPKSDRE